MINAFNSIRTYAVTNYRGDEMHAANQPIQRAGYTHHMVQGICAKLPHREKETMNFSQPTINLSKAHSKLDPLQDIQPEGKI